MKTATKIGIRRISGTNLRFFSALKIIQILIPFEFSIFISGNISRSSTSKREREKKLTQVYCQNFNLNAHLCRGSGEHYLVPYYQCDQIGAIFINLAKLREVFGNSVRVFLVHGKIFNLLGYMFYAIGQFFIFKWPNFEHIIQSSSHTAYILNDLNSSFIKDIQAIRKFFQTQIVQKNCKLLWDSNSDCHSGRLAC